MRYSLRLWFDFRTGLKVLVLISQIVVLRAGQAILHTQMPHGDCGRVIFVNLRIVGYA
jgi:hypothetical protein